jgi:hypothetical protein
MKRVPPHASPKVGNIRLPDGTADVLDVLALLNGISFFCANTLELYPPEGFCATKAAFAVANTERFRAALDSNT